MDTAARKTQLKSITEEYFTGMAKKDWLAVPYDDHVMLRSPLAPGDLSMPMVGRQAVLVIGSHRYGLPSAELRSLSTISTRA